VPVAGVKTPSTTTGPVPADGTSLGELQVCGPTLFDGYLGLPGRRPRRRGRWFRTGDVATIATGPTGSSGVHRSILIKSGGYRIGAERRARSRVILVAECAVIGVPDDDLGQRIVAVVVPAGPAPDELATELIDLVVAQLSVHKRPREVRFVAALPRNEMGKVQKTRLT
jgi:fatty acid CoA ligase FadD36